MHGAGPCRKMDIEAEMPARRTELSPTQGRVLDILRAASRPLSAYDILGELRGEGVNAPPTVYRALERLMRDGLAHRVESLNAFVACTHPHHESRAILAVCNVCGAVEEMADADIEARLVRLAGSRGFHAESVALELRGHCAACGDRPHGHAHA